MEEIRRDDFMLKSNFILDREQKGAISHIMSSLALRAPAYSQMELDLSYKNGEGFSGKLRVFSGKKTFYVTDAGDTINILMRSLYKKIRKQLMKWKRSRSRDEITGVFQLSELMSGEDLNQLKEAG